MICYGMKRALIALLLTASPAMAQTAQADCACIGKGGTETPLGQVICLTVGGQSFLARCAMSQNVLTWRKVQDGCPAARAATGLSPPIQPL